MRRAETTFTDGVPSYAWSTVATNVPCLLDAAKGEREDTGEQQTRDRAGVLTVGPHPDLRAGDVVTITRGPAGTFRLSPEPAERWGFYGMSHREFDVTEGS